MFPVDSVIIINKYGQLTKFCHHASNATSNAYGCVAGLKPQKPRLPCKCIANAWLRFKLINGTDRANCVLYA